ncbi:MAG TPA: hypothetical protein PKA90_13465 [Ignavibacteria bacterium]|nr:hypothetical protein [Ignavibacteria bacterium]HMR41428.1 hypothetical protein [Ignavibacteria bacterium]
MRIFLFLFIIQLASFSYNTVYCQNSSITKQDALDFIKNNLDHSNNSSDADASVSFYEIFNGEDFRYMDYSFKGQTSYTVISAQSCIIKLVETTSGNSKISYAEFDENPEDSRIYSKFEYLKQDTITIDFSKISKIESGKTSITFVSYDNKDLIKHNYLITQIPPKKRENDLIRVLKSEEEDMYKKLKKFFEINNINYTVYPVKTEHFDSSDTAFTLSNIDKDRCKKLAKAFEFLQKNCGVPDEKF